MNVLVLGGTGAIGKHLSDTLVEMGFRVFVTTRQCLSSTRNKTYIRGDARDWSFVVSLIGRKWDVIVDFMAYSTSDFKIRVSALLANTDQYIFLSSARVYADSPIPLTEDSPRLLDVITDKKYLKTDEYALSKARQENLLINSGDSNWTIVRPYITYSENRLQLGVLEKEFWLQRALKGKCVVQSRDILERRTTLTYGKDVARAIISLIGKEKALGEAFHLTCNHTRRWGEILGIYERAFSEIEGRALKVKSIDTEPQTRFHDRRYQIIYDRLFDRVFNNSKLGGILEHDSFLPPENGLSSCLKEFLRDPRFSGLNAKNEGICDKLTGEYTPFADFGGWKKKIQYICYRYGVLK